VIQNFQVGLNAGALAIAAVLAVAVYADALRFGRRHGWRNGFPSLGPASWGVFVLVLWPVAVPWYAVRRYRLARSSDARAKAVGQRAVQDEIRRQRT
jgi:hypothetical protein